MKQEKYLVSAIDAHTSGDLKNSESLYRKFLRTNPTNHTANNNLGLILLSTGRAEEATVIFQKLVKMFPQDKYALLNLGNCHIFQKQLDLALNCFKQSKDDFPELDLAWFNFANCLKDMGRFEESLVAYDRTLTLNDKNAKAWLNRSISLYKLHRYEEALRSQEQSLKLNPTFIEALVNKAETSLALGKNNDALESAEKAIVLRPDMVGVWAGFASVMRAMHRYKDAIDAYEKAISIAPDTVGLLDNFGKLLTFLKDPKAVSIYRRLILLEPNHDYVLGRLIHTKMQACDWSSLDANTKQCIHDGIIAAKKVITPLELLSLSDSPEDQLVAAKIYLKNMGLPPSVSLKTVGAVGRRLRIAYLSGDLREHAVSALMRGVFESHDRSRFETFAISFLEQPDSPYQSHLKTQFDHWLNVDNETDDFVVECLRALEIDIAVDLTGFTNGSRTELFARRISPIQVNYLGYPGTLGAEFIDYIIADQYVIPPSEVSNYAEKIVFLPDCFQANDSRKGIPQIKCSRIEFGIPENSFVFCCLNNSYKISPEIFAIWMRLLKAVEGSVLWLLGENQTVRNNLCRAAIEHHIEPERLVFAQRRSYAEYLSSYRLADLFLDTFPFNAGTTASDALWAGLPIITCSGRAFASRMAGSLLQSVGLPELITSNLEQYEAQALKLAFDKEYLSVLRNRLEVNRLSGPLFNAEIFTRNLESAYLQMYNNSLNSN